MSTNGQQKDEQTGGRIWSFLTWIYCFPGCTVEHLQHLEVQDLFPGMQIDSDAQRSSYPILHRSHWEPILAWCIHVSRALLYERVIKNWTKELFSADGDETGARWSDERQKVGGSLGAKVTSGIVSSLSPVIGNRFYGLRSKGKVISTPQSRQDFLSLKSSRALVQVAPRAEGLKRAHRRARSSLVSDWHGNIRGGNWHISCH